MIEKNKIYLGDAFKLFKKVEDNSVDLILTDPPYGIDYQSNLVRNNILNDKLRFDKIEGDTLNPKLIHNFVKQAYRILKNDTCMFVFTTPKVVCEWKKEIENYFSIKNYLLWIKKPNFGGMGDIESSFFQRYEIIIFCMKGKKTLFKNGLNRKDGIFFGNYELNHPSQMIHPAQKPVGLIKDLILPTTNKGDLIIDPFIGIGTTAKASYLLERDCIGFEKVSSIYKTAIDQIKNIKQQKRIRDF